MVMAVATDISEGGDPSTRERLMTAAERLFAEQDYEDVSVRAVNVAAGTNAAAVHYYFGSKEALVGAILERRMDQLDQWRQARRAELVKGGRRPTRRQVVELLVRPLLDLMRDEPASGPTYVRLLTRLYLQRAPIVIRQAQTTEPMWDELVAMACADSNMSDEQIRLRWMLVVDSAFVALNWRFSRQDRFADPELDWEAKSDELLDFLAAGFGGVQPASADSGQQEDT
jgi:AcrR family transcriptional regulator